MHSYKTLAVLALAVSTASPAFSAPVQYASCLSILGTVLADELIIIVLVRANNRPVPTLMSVRALFQVVSDQISEVS